MVTDKISWLFPPHIKQLSKKKRLKFFPKRILITFHKLLRISLRVNIHTKNPVPHMTIAHSLVDKIVTISSIHLLPSSKTPHAFTFVKSISRHIIHSYYHFSKSTVVISQHLCILLQKNPTYYM